MRIFNDFCGFWWSWWLLRCLSASCGFSSAFLNGHRLAVDFRRLFWKFRRHLWIFIGICDFLSAPLTFCLPSVDFRRLSMIPHLDPAQSADLDDDIEGEESLGEDELIIQADDDGLIIDEGPVDCLPESCYKKFPIFAGDEDSPFWQGWGNLRLKTFRLIENKYFETAVITMILLSSLALVRLTSST